MKKDLNALFRVDGKTAVITGAGRGIGKAVADLVAARCCQVFATIGVAAETASITP